MDLCCEICGAPIEWNDEVVRIESGEARGNQFLKALFGYFQHSPARTVVHFKCLEDIDDGDSYSQVCRKVAFNAAGVELKEVDPDG